MMKIDRQKIAKFAVPLLAVVMIAVWWPRFQKKSGEDSIPKTLSPKQDKELEEVHEFIRSIASDEKPRLSEFERWGRDPFYKTPIAAVTEAVDSFPLRGIFWDEEKPSALIGETAVFVGDQLDHFTVTDIQPTEVILTDGQKVIRLNLKD